MPSRSLRYPYDAHPFAEDAKKWYTLRLIFIKGVHPSKFWKHVVLLRIGTKVAAD
jgi:hypothetical protein